MLPTLGCKRLVEHPGAIRASHRQANAYGKQYPEFWVGTTFDGQPATVGNGTHIGFIAPSKEAVHAFYEAALVAGGKDDGAPGERHYHPGYYAAFLLDPDGNNIEAVYHGAAERSAPSVVITTPGLLSS